VKLVRFGPVGAERPGVLRGGQVTEVGEVVGDFDAAFFARGGPVALAVELDRRRDLPVHDVAGVERWGAPVARPGKVVCIGLNYAVHAAEARMDLPAEPVVFMKAPSTVVGPDDDVLIPVGGQKTDWEVELGVVIGRTARAVTVEDALGHVFGYTVGNDVSARDLQFGDGQWVRGKSLDTFCPVGPVIVTADEIPDPQSLRLTCSVNGEVMQDATTGLMVFGVAELISFCSHSFTLEPGDLLLTGTPWGCGEFMDPKRSLAPGDVVECEIDGIGILRNPVTAG
jgi:2-keto-4-pentenoate hydratase/2-oxohepta-3-ene-1,7-dioic acid hydratase in catechol pathway